MKYMKDSPLVDLDSKVDSFVRGKDYNFRYRDAHIKASKTYNRFYIICPVRGIIDAGRTIDAALARVDIDYLANGASPNNAPILNADVLKKIRSPDLRIKVKKPIKPDGAPSYRKFFHKKQGMVALDQTKKDAFCRQVMADKTISSDDKIVIMTLAKTGISVVGFLSIKRRHIKVSRSSVTFQTDKVKGKFPKEVAEIVKEKIGHHQAEVFPFDRHKILYILKSNLGRDVVAASLQRDPQ